MVSRSSNDPSLRDDLLRIYEVLGSGPSSLDHTRPLLKAALDNDLGDEVVWDRAYDAVVAVPKTTLAPRPIPTSLQKAACLPNTSSFANSSDHRYYVDGVLAEEFGPMHVCLRAFHQVFFGDVPNLEPASKVFFKDCSEGSNPLFNDGWIDWFKEAKLDDMLSWFAGFYKKLLAFAESYNSAPAHKRRPLGVYNQPMDASDG